MGDRGNIVVVDEYDLPPVYLYSHWGGRRLGEELAKALARQQRWNDGPYLARIIFDTMTEGDHGEETGYGISTAPPDNQHPFLVVDVARRRVLIGDAAIAATLRERIVGDEPEGFVVVPFTEHERLAQAYKGAH